MTFVDLRLAEPLLAALHHEGYQKPTPIQAQAIPPILEGRDLMGCAQTGTGKTAAFSLPLLQRVMIESPNAPHKGTRRQIRALVLSPTRELASQIAQSIRAYGGKTGVRYAVIFGGVGQNPQVDALRSGVDVLVATPGRLLDLMNQKLIDLSHVEVFVLDEADRMLDMGFVHDIRRVIAVLPQKRQNLMFSATMPAEIKKLADSFLHQPAYVQIAPVSSTAERIQQFIYYVPKEDKADLLAHLYEAESMSRVLVFTRTKHGADRVVRKLHRDGIHAEAIHGNKSQNARQRALGNFKTGRTNVLVATDIAARGIDVDSISHVVNFDIPNEPETYVHRIGRTGRAGAEGIAFSFCDTHGEEKSWLRDIERLTKQKIPTSGETPKFERKPQEDKHHEHEDRGHRATRRDDREHRSERPQDAQRKEHPHRSDHPRRQEHRSDRSAHSNRTGHRNQQGDSARHTGANRSDHRSHATGSAHPRSHSTPARPHTAAKPSHHAPKHASGPAPHPLSGKKPHRKGLSLGKLRKKHR